MIGLIVILLVAGAVMYLVPMDARIKQLIYVVIVLAVVLVLLDLFGIWHWGGNLHLGR